MLQNLPKKELWVRLNRTFYTLQKEIKKTFKNKSIELYFKLQMPVNLRKQFMSSKYHKIGSTSIWGLYNKVNLKRLLSATGVVIFCELQTWSDYFETYG